MSSDGRTCIRTSDTAQQSQAQRRLFRSGFAFTKKPRVMRALSKLMSTLESQSLSSCNRITKAYISTAFSLARESKKSNDREEQRAKSAASIQMAVSFVEAFFNVSARLLVEQEPNRPNNSLIEKDLNSRASLGEKLKKWPCLFFGKSVDYSSGIGEEFQKLVYLRNSLIHFTSDSHTYEADNIKIKSLIDTTDYDQLNGDIAFAASKAALFYVKHLIELQGIEHVESALQHWAGKPIEELA